MKDFFYAIGIVFVMLTIAGAANVFVDWLKNKAPKIYTILMIILLMGMIIFVWYIIKI